MHSSFWKLFCTSQTRKGLFRIPWNVFIKIFHSYFSNLMQLYLKLHVNLILIVLPFYILQNCHGNQWEKGSLLHIQENSRAPDFGRGGNNWRKIHKQLFSEVGERVGRDEDETESWRKPGPGRNVVWHHLSEYKPEVRHMLEWIPAQPLGERSLHLSTSWIPYL